jgi:UDP-N-acetylglucosamine 2-epimerase
MYDDTDVDRVVDELNAFEGLPSVTAAETARLMSWLDDVVAREANDLLLVAGDRRPMSWWWAR